MGIETSEVNFIRNNDSRSCGCVYLDLGMILVWMTDMKNTASNPPAVGVIFQQRPMARMSAGELARQCESRQKRGSA